MAKKDASGASDSSKIWSVFSLVSALGAAAVAKKGLNTTWKAATRRNPPENPADPDVELRVNFDDFVDVIAGRLDPKKAVATRRLRLKGSPRALWRARGVF